MSAASWSLLLYAIAGDATEHHTVLGAIDDMRATLSSAHCHVAAQVMAKGRTTRYWISSEDNLHTEVLPEVADASHQAPLTGFLDAAHQRFPAASTALTLWAHGTGLDHVHEYHRRPGGPGGGLGGGLEIDAPRRPGATAGTARSARRPMVARSPRRRDEYGCRWGPDPNSGKFLTNVTMKKAIAASAHGRVDLLGLNACWMATLEVEYELRHAAAVLVASQVYARPWPYGAIVESLSRRPAQSAEQLARTIVATASSEIAADQRQDAVSAFRAGADMDELAAAFDRFAARATELIDSDWTAVHDAVMTRAQRIDDPYQVDLVSLVKVLGRHDRKAQDAAHAVTRQIDAMRIGNAAHPSHPGVHGLSIFCPKSTDIDLADAYAGTEFRSNRWAEFLAKFQAQLAAAPA